MYSSASLFVISICFVSLSANHDIPRRKWTSELFIESRSYFSLKENVSEPCKSDFEIYLSNLENQTVWAVRMMESSEWPVTGLYAGRTKHLGNWAECLRVSTSAFKGQYCLARLKFNFSDGLELNYSYHMRPEEMQNISTWQSIKIMEKNLFRASRREYMWALCVPSSCTVQDLENSLYATIGPIFSNHALDLTIEVKQQMCQTSDTPIYSTGLHRTSYFFAVIVGFVILCTIYNLLKRNSNSQLVKMFSLLGNYEKLFDDSGLSLRHIFYLTRIIAMLVIITAHTYYFGIQHSVLQTEEIEALHSPYSTVVDSLPDLFFALSGYLMFDNNLSGTIKGGFTYIAIKVIFKHIKLMSTYILHVLFWVNIVPFLNDGPFWKSEMLEEIGICKNYWWLNVFGLANLAPDRICLRVTWFSNILIQLNLIGGLLVYIMTVNRKRGVYLMFSCFMIGISLTFLIVYQRNYDAIFLKIFCPRIFDDAPLYVGTYSRIGPYMLGFGGAVLTDVLQRRNYKFTKIQTIAILSCTTAIAFKVALYRSVFHIPDRPYNALENALYAAVQRFTLILPFICLYCIYFTSPASWLKSFVEMKFIVILGRLVELVYLIHEIIIRQKFNSQKTFSSISASLYADTFWTIIACTVISFALAFLVHLLIDSPIKNIIDWIEKKLKRKFVNTEEKID